MSSASRRLFYALQDDLLGASGSFRRCRLRSQLVPKRATKDLPTGNLLPASSSYSGFGANLNPHRKSEDRHHTTSAPQSQAVTHKKRANFMPSDYRGGAARQEDRFQAVLAIMDAPFTATKVFCSRGMTLGLPSAITELRPATLTQPSLQIPTRAT